MLNAFRAEIGKWRHNWFPWVAAGAELSGVLLVLLTGLLRSETPEAGDMMSNVLLFHLMLVGPLVVTLIGAQFIAAEYQWDSWKVVLTAPVPRWAAYLAKWLLGVIWILALSVLVPLAAFGAVHLVHAPGSLDYWAWMKACVMGGVGLCALLSCYHFVTLVTRNFFVASAVGIVAAFASLLAVQSRYIGLFPISGNFMMAQMWIGRKLQSGSAIIGTPAVWTGVLVAMALAGLVASLLYVQKADYR